MRAFCFALLAWVHFGLGSGFSFAARQTFAPDASRPRGRATTPAMGNEDAKGAVGGAVLGGLLAGPFGALWGAQIGSAMGANSRSKREDTDALAALGISDEVMRLAQSTAADLGEAEEALAMVERAEGSQRSVLSTIERSLAEEYAAAEEALRNGDEGEARRRLENRQALKLKQATAEADLRAAMERVASMQASVAALAGRANEIEQAISRSVVATRTGVDQPPERLEDPLERRFRDLER